MKAVSTINKIETDLNNEIKLAILKKAAKIKTSDNKKAKAKKKKKTKVQTAD